MPHDLSHLGFLAGQIGRLITISTTPVIAGDSFEMDAVGALRLSPLRRGLAIDSTVDIFTFYSHAQEQRNAAQNVYRSVEHDQKTGLTTFGQFHQHHSQMPRDRKSGSAGMPRPISYAVFCLKKKKTK